MDATNDGALRRLDPRVIALDRMVGWIVSASVSAGLFAGVIIFWLASSLGASGLLVLGSAWLVVSALIAWLMYRWPPLHYRYTSYTLDARGIEIRTGVYWRTVVAVPRSRVQHIDVSQGPLERSYGLGTLIIYTAGTAHSQVGLSGLDHPVALALRDHLLPTGADDAI